MDMLDFYAAILTVVLISMTGSLKEGAIRGKVKMAEQPMQPIVRDHKGVIRFQANAIARHLLDVATEAGVCDLNQIACLPFSLEDREQFAQLIGYSLDGFADLSYVSAETYVKAVEAWDASQKAGKETEN